MRSLENAKERSRELLEPLYMVQARDEVIHLGDERKMTDVVRTDLLRRVNPRDTQGLPSFLPLYRGMRLLLSSKDCVRLGIMKGCTVILRDIVFAEEEILPYREQQLAGHPHSLQYMPVSLLLQAEDVSWILAEEDLPANLPRGIDRPGIFQLRRTSSILRIKLEDN